jgi:hypothetical protein
MTKSCLLAALETEIIPRLIPNDEGLSYHQSVFFTIRNPCVRGQAMVFPCPQPRKKGGLRVNTYFRHHRQRGPVNALQMRLQG